MRGSFELGARVLTSFLFLLMALGPAFGMGFSAWVGVAHQHRLAIAVLFWVLCCAWQAFSALAPALAGQNPELSHLLRYPVSFRSWVLLFLVYGVFAPSTLIGLIWAFGIGVGITVARPDLFLPAAATLGLFVFFNILLARTILAWIERWMAQRRTREIFTGIMLLLALCSQALNPIFHQGGLFRHDKPTHHQPPRFPTWIWPAQSALPPGVATNAIVLPMTHKSSSALPLGELALYTFAVAALLLVRLRAESRGENLSEAPRRVASAKAREQNRIPAFLDFSGPVAAVFEKDLRYLLRSGPMLYALAVPLVMVFLFGSAIRSGEMGRMRAEYALPLALIWAFLGLTRLLTNNLGTEGQGLHFFYLSPTPLRTVILGKNALHFVLFLVEAVLITGIVVSRFGFPEPHMAAATLAWILFALPANFGIGNLMSILMPYRLSANSMRTPPGAMGNGLLTALTQFSVVGVGALVYLPCAAFDHRWLATPILLALAAGAWIFYARTLANVDRLMQSRQESLLLDIAKTA